MQAFFDIVHLKRQLGKVLTQQQTNKYFRLFSSIKQQQNNHYEEISLQQLHSMCTNVHSDLILQNQQFLTKQFNMRLQAHIQQCQHFPILQRYQNKLLNYYQENNIDDSLMSKRAIKKIISEIEFLVRQQQSLFEIDARKPEYWKDQNNFMVINKVSNIQNEFLIKVRLLLQQQMAALDVLENKQKVESKVNLVWENCNVYNFVRGVVEDCMAFSVEKNSTSPAVNVTGDKDLTIITVDSYLCFAIAEMLKNGMQALIRLYGAWDVDEADPIEFQISKINDGYFQMKIKDTGGGIPEEVLKLMCNYYYTTTIPNEPKYGYSRDHGSKMHGLGVGIPLTELYCKLMGGSVDWNINYEKKETEVIMKFPTKGFSF
eukprot:TRINITY_DN5008_c1_g1_i1.p1 TRINITY_DN5008_c1_g1~~TRINITY_DN5008_c1_g1_i1.p1  ORF type:complete len:373 (-),score=21.70 TRINITY_DN5008_c1_g1_i1:248-1366(-)